MNLVVFIMFLNLCLSLLFMITMYSISIKSLTNREKSSPFECGFNPQNSSRLPFSIQFFIVGVVFLIFDVEISLLIPMPMLISSSYMPSMITTSMTLICVLLIGLYYEWYTGALKWFK